MICKKTGHFAQSKSCKNEKHVRSVIKTESPPENTSNDTESDGEIGCIVVSAVNTGKTNDEIVTIKINGKTQPNGLIQVARKH